jgi:hypothetical protein
LFESIKLFHLLLVDLLSLETARVETFL